jgi:hypothetical protein
MPDANSRHIALVLLEGDTEEEFYSRVAAEAFPQKRKAFRNLRGNFNVNSKIVDAAIHFAASNPGDRFDVYVCVDQERPNYPAYNHNLVHAELSRLPNFRGLFPVIAVLMIESLFFIDIDGIYRFLRTKKTVRKPGKFASFRRLTHRDLSQIFKQSGRVYIKGIRCQHFVNSLDVRKIISNAGELRSMVANIVERS